MLMLFDVKCLRNLFNAASLLAVQAISICQIILEILMMDMMADEEM